MKKTTVAIEGLDLTKEEFEILDRDELMDKIDKLDWNQIYKETYMKTQGQFFSGQEITYIDARDGSIDTYWLQQNHYQHPFNDYYEIILCRISTPLEMPDDIEFLNEDEYEIYQEGLECFNPELEHDKWDLVEFAEINNINLEERLEEIIDNYAYQTDMHIDDVEFQINNLYEKQVEDE